MSYKNYRNLLTLYYNNNILFKNCKKDREKIHKYEWENDLSDFSILFEVELLDGFLHGFVCDIVDNKYERINETIEAFSKKSIYDSKIILDWLTEENILKYPAFYNYLLFLENLRVLTLKVCVYINKGL